MEAIPNDDTFYYEYKGHSYTKDKSLMDKDLYFNSFFFNHRGRKIFTQLVLKDIGK